jgi:hypothetical protein
MGGDTRNFLSTKAKGETGAVVASEVIVLEQVVQNALLGQARLPESVCGKAKWFRELGMGNGRHLDQFLSKVAFEQGDLLRCI